MQGVRCPFCDKVMFTFWPKKEQVNCIYCQRKFFVDYDDLKHTWISIAIKEGKNNAGET